MTVVTRFAPSPTGFLHIGSARTALFCWLFARAHGGKFLLRIEDTDRERSTEAAVSAILDGLDWLGLQPDEPPLFQSTRAERHRQVALDLVQRGAAYHCPVSAEELEGRRNAAAVLKREAEISARLTPEEQAALLLARETLQRPFRSAWRNGDRAIPSGAPTVVRLRMPDEGRIEVDDAVQGRVKVAARELDDLILLRSDGAPTYMLAVVVDDHDMGVTHVIRGDDHLTNTFRQLPIYHAMDWMIPVFAHVPMIHGPDGKKLSKRHGALGVEAYRDMGYLPEALRNYLLRLGWSHGDDEIISTEQAVKWFGLEGLNKAPARLDFDKLAAVNAHYLALLPDDRIRALMEASPGFSHHPEDVRRRVLSAAGVLKSRAKTVPDLMEQARFLTDVRPIRIEGRAQELMTAETRGRLKRLARTFEGLETWRETDIKEALQGFAASEGVGMGKIGPGLRAALTGGAPAPDLSLVAALLGREETIGRLDDIETGFDDRT